MKRNWLLAAALAATTTALVSAPAAAATKFEFWYGLSGDLSERIQDMCKTFNESQSDVHVDYQFQGNYEETAQKLTAALAAKQTPDVSALSDVWVWDSR